MIGTVSAPTEPEMTEEPVMVASVFENGSPENPPYQLKNVNYKPQGNIVSQRSYEEPIPGFHAESPDLIPLGTYASAQVTSHIVWGMGDNRQYTIQLTEDVYTNTNQVAIPTGASLIVVPGALNESNGLAELAVVGISVNGQSFPVDYGVISVNAKDGNPLIAKNYGNTGRDIARNDFEMVAIGALAGIGQELIRPDTETTTTSAFGATTSRSGNGGNILGGALAGASEQLADRMSDRNDRRLDDIQNREPVWYIPAGEEIEIVFNQDME